MKTSARPWLAGILLALPLVLVSAWLIRGVLRPAAPPRPASAAALAPALDLPAARLEERVNGAAPALRAAGCVRLVHWRSQRPPADVEALVFDTAPHARLALEREAGPERTAGPGEEALVSEQAVYFRTGRVVVRAFADPGASDGAALLRLAGGLEPAVTGLR